MKIQKKMPPQVLCLSICSDEIRNIEDDHEENENEIHGLMVGTVNICNALKAKGYLVLCTTIIDRRKVALLVMLILCQSIGLLASMHYVIELICQWNDECYLCLSPISILGTLLLILTCIEKWGCTTSMRSRLFSMKNGVMFWIKKNKSQNMLLDLDTELVSKAYYGPNLGVPISMLQCQWKSMLNMKRARIKIACFRLPACNEELHIPITCDAIDMLRVTKKLNSLGILLIKYPEKTYKLDKFLLFLFQSGFTILCNAQPSRTIMAMKHHNQTNVLEQWKVESIGIHNGDISLKLSLHDPLEASSFYNI